MMIDLLDSNQYSASSSCVHLSASARFPNLIHLLFGDRFPNRIHFCDGDRFFQPASMPESADSAVTESVISARKKRKSATSRAIL
ncbi:hypothetical protein PENTCL1PPCAC_8961, partial [Pristionchus entomophagus]